MEFDEDEEYEELKVENFDMRGDLRGDILKKRP